MYIDNELLLSDDQAVTATADSTNVIDLTSDRDVGRGTAQALFVSVSVTAQAADETYRFDLETDDNEAMATPVLIAGGAVAAADLVEGSRHVFPMGITNQRYLQGVYTTAGTAPAVTITACVSPMDMIATEDVVYPAGVPTI